MERPYRTAFLIGSAIFGFLFLLRPFGLEVHSVTDVIILGGVIPLNAGMIVLVHRWILPHLPQKSERRRVIALGLIVAGNFLYFINFTDEKASLALKVVLVTAVSAGVIWSWQRHRTVHGMLIELEKEAAETEIDVLSFRGEGDRDILQLDPKALRYAKSEGNYVRLVWSREQERAEQLLRTTLGTVEEEAKGYFIRCHRSYLVNLAGAERIAGPSRSMKVHFPDETAVPVARRYAEGILKAASPAD